VISVTLARRYARALLDLSVRQKDLPETQESLQGVAALFRGDSRVRRFFETPNLSRTEKEDFLERQWKPRLSRPAYGLVRLLLRRRRLDHLVAISDEFNKLAEEARGILRAVVRTAVPISEGQADALTQALARRTGKNVILSREIDGRLLGGVSVSLDHQVIDGTLATALGRIRHQLLEARVHGRG
jgi:F-type H+-transporting ATPase subunit delta